METIQKNDDKGPIVIRAKMGMTANPHGIAPGSIVEILISIVDEYETIKTTYHKFTKDLAIVEKSKPSAPGTIAQYSERLQKTIIKFPGMKKEQIAKIVANDLAKIPTVK